MYFHFAFTLYSVSGNINPIVITSSIALFYSLMDFKNDYWEHRIMKCVGSEPFRCLDNEVLPISHFH